MLPSDRRTFLGLLSSLAGSLASRRAQTQQPVIEVRPTALFQQPEGRKNLVRITVSGLSAPAAPHTGEALDALLAPLDPHRRRLHRSPGAGARGASQKPRRRARVDDNTT